MMANLGRSVGTGTKEDESSNGHIWAAGFHHVMAHSRLARFETYEPFMSLIFQIFSGRSKPQIAETANMGVHLYKKYYEPVTCFLNMSGLLLGTNNT
jgi:hypothetical protein